MKSSSDLCLQLGRRLVEIQIKLFSIDHLYAADQFNEADPSSRILDYLAKCGSTQFVSVRRGDLKAIWVMQGWLFVNSHWFWRLDQIQAYLSMVPADRLVILGLIA